MTALLEAILPILSEKRVPFRMARNPRVHYNLNIGKYGWNKVGKVITLYARTEQEAVELANILLPVTQHYSGPRINKSIQLGPALFTYLDKYPYAERHKTTLLFKGAGILFKGSRHWINISSRRFIGKHYLVIKTIRKSVKGNIYKAISFINGRIKWCIIKEGRLNMVDDLFGRTIRDRLLWQKTIHDDLKHIKQIPTVWDFFDDYGDSYLVMRYVRGGTLTDKIRAIYQRNVWGALPPDQQTQLLDFYIEVLEIVDKIHQEGYIHRDIKDGNLIVLPNGKPYLLDFELAYSAIKELPHPPFRMSANGYTAPEQLENIIPSAREDIYSMGALLFYLLTGISPKVLSIDTMDAARARMKDSGLDTILIDIVLLCVNKDPFNRPSIDQLISAVTICKTGKQTLKLRR